MDEERKEVLALLEGMATNRRRGSSTGDARSPSPYAVRSPVRSMLDIGSNGLAPVTAQSPQSLGFVPSAKKSPSATAPVRSMLDIDSPPKQTVRSMLDVDSPPPSAKSKTPSNPASPIEPNHRAPAARQATAHPRSMSDASASPADFGPRAPSARQDPTADFQFSGIITQGAGQSMPKRVSRGGKRQMVMSEALRGELPKLPASDRGSHYSIAGPTMPTISRTSKSPSSRIAVRSMSPHNLLPVRALSPGRRILQPEVPNETYDANAYRRLSDAHLARSLGSLSELTRRKKRENNAKSGRLTKDYLSPDGELLADSSDDNGSSSEEEGARGRQAARKFGSSGSSGSVNNSQAGSLSPDIHRKTSSLLWAAEEERAYSFKPGRDTRAN